jgi:septal ring factor EnvC (AmiA/AmiB activator)
MTGFHHATHFDAERAVSQLDQQGQALAKMTSAESQRIDGLVKDVGAIKGDVSAVNNKVDSVVSGVDKLNTAMADMVKFTIRVEHQHQAQDAYRATVAAHEQRIQTLEKQVDPLVKAKLDERVPTLEKQIGPLIELRTWVIGLCLGAAGLIVAKLADLLGK